MAFLMVLGVLGILIVIGLTLSQTSLVGRWGVTFSTHGKRAEEVAEAASNYTFRLAQENMNDFRLFTQALQQPGNFFEVGGWFTQFRLPAVIGGAAFNAAAAKGLKNQAVAEGIDIELDLSEPVLKPVYDQGIRYRYVYDSQNRGSGNTEFVILEQLLESLGGRTTIDVHAKVNKAYAILPRSNTFEVGGITTPLTPPQGGLGRLLDLAENGAFALNVNLLNLIPGDNIVQEGIESSLNNITAKFGTPPFWIPIGQILNVIGATEMISEAIVDALGLEDLTLRSLAQGILGNSLTLNLDLSGLQNLLQQTILSLLPDQLRLFIPALSWSATIEKIGSLQVTTHVEYQPNFPGQGPTIKRTLVSEREFRVSDIQPVAPDYTLFVANSDKLYETPEEQDGWTGNRPISWNAGEGELVLHHLPSFPEIVNSLSGLSANLAEITQAVRLPGMVRVNGTDPGNIRLSFTFPSSSEQMKLNEIPALAVNDKDVIPQVEVTDWDFGGGNGWDWPYFQDSGWWIPMIPMYNRTLLFGNMDLEVPLNLRVEGYLNRKYNRIKILMVNIWLPPVPPFFLGFGFVIPWFWATEETERYGINSYPSEENGENPATLWNPDEPRNFPQNLYSTAQYLKKSSHFYNSSQEFWDDVPRRSKTRNGETAFQCDGISFINGNFTLPNELKVVGRGMIVALGNIHVGADVRRVAEDELGNPTVFSLVSRNGGLINNSPAGVVIEACVYADRGVFNECNTDLTIRGNLVVNRFERGNCQGKVHIHYQSRHARSSLLSLVRPIAKWDPSRYIVSMAAKYKSFEFVKQ